MKFYQKIKKEKKKGEIKEEEEETNEAVMLIPCELRY